jgi:3-isopropylmalate/(R)-2-methylmalate dehydratase large subunit
VRRIEVNGTSSPGVYAKDVVLHIIRTLGVKGAWAMPTNLWAPPLKPCSMEERMTLCNMAIEGRRPLRLRQSRCKVTYDYLRGGPLPQSS